MSGSHGVPRHKPVLLKEVIEALDLTAGETLLDGTLGSAGHSEALLKNTPGVTLIGLDRDEEALERSRENLRAYKRSTYLYHESFRHLDKVLAEVGLREVDAILLDLGISSEQLDASLRGFSFMRDEYLHMSMKKKLEKSDLDAADILNTFPESTLELILRGFGEEKYSRKIVKEIVARREEKPFESTKDLVEAVLRATPPHYHRARIHPATRTFQALRIAVNAELEALEEGLEKGFKHLRRGGRFAIISFHSLEDRVVKNFFRERVRAGEAKLITKKPRTADKDELELNPRSRSARLRVIEKL